MKLHLIRRDAEGYQEPWQTGEPAPSMPVTFLEAELESDDGTVRLTLGRLWFTPDGFERMGSDVVTVVGERIPVA